MSFRLRLRSLFILTGFLILFVAPDELGGPQPVKPLDAVRRLAWLNNWSAAADTLDELESLGRLPTDDTTALFARAVRIRGRVETLPLPKAAEEITIMLASEAARRNRDLRVHLLAIRGDIEFQYDLSAAEQSWAEARDVAVQAGLGAWKARADGELGTIAFLGGKIMTGLRLVASAALKAELYGDVAGQIRYRTALGEGLAEFGRSADAIRFFDNALQLSQSTPGAYFPFTAYLGKARLLATTGHAAEGRRMLLRGLAESRASALRVREARILTTLGELAANAGRHREALDWLRQAAEVARHAGLHRVESDACERLAATAVKLGDVQTAAAFARRSVSATRNAGDLYSLPQKLAVLAEMERASGHLGQAEDAYTAAADMVEALLQELPNPKSRNTLIATMERVFQGHFDLALNGLGDPEKAFDVLESARARGLADTLRGDHAKGIAAPVPTAAARQLNELHNRLSAETDLSRRDRLLDQLWELETRTFGAGAARQTPSADRRIKPVALRELRSVLEEGEVVVEYLLGPSASVALAINRHGIARYRLAGSREIESVAAIYLDAVRDMRDARLEARRLYELVLAPLEPVRSARRLVIVPDGRLHLVPFGALINELGRYVMETKLISYAPSATVHYLLQRAPSLHESQGGLLAVGGVRYRVAGLDRLQAALRGRSLFDSSAPPLFSPLPQATAEVAAVSEFRPGRTVLLSGDDATEYALRDTRLSDFEVLHFAVHSTVDQEFPDRSALVLSPQPTGVDDGLLQAREILGLDLNASLVTLSACDGGAGKVEGIAGMNSLVQAFLMAGAHSVVASVWDADDTFTAALMRRFYDHLRTGFDKAEALTLAKRDLLRMHGPNALPFYWAGFRLIGDPHGRISGE
jgi:CHAT domain-containing protein